MPLSLYLIYRSKSSSILPLSSFAGSSATTDGDDDIGSKVETELEGDRLEHDKRTKRKNLRSCAPHEQLEGVLSPFTCEHPNDIEEAGSALQTPQFQQDQMGWSNPPIQGDTGDNLDGRCQRKEKYGEVPRRGFPGEILIERPSGIGEGKSLRERGEGERGQDKRLHDATNKDFIHGYYQASRLHHLSLWRAQFEDELNSFLMSSSLQIEHPPTQRSRTSRRNDSSEGDSEEESSGKEQIGGAEAVLIRNDDRVIMHVDMVP